MRHSPFTATAPLTLPQGARLLTAIGALIAGRTCIAGDAPLFNEIRLPMGAASNPRCAIAVDLTGDGRPEVVGGEDGASASRLRTFVNNGFGLFSVGGTVLPPTAFPIALAAADLDGDLDQDVVEVSFSNGAQVVVHLNAGGVLASGVIYSVGAFPRCVALGDLDDDGDADMVVGNAGANGVGNTVSMLLNNGNGTFAPQTAYSVGLNPSIIRVVDIDSDRDLDWIVAHEGSNFVTIAEQLGDGSFSRLDVDVGGGTVGLVASDLDGDTDLDMAVLRSVPGDIRLLLNNGGLSFTVQAPLSLTWFPGRLAAGDMDGDGDTDLLGVVAAAGRVNVLLNDGSGGFPGEIINPTINDVSEPSLADVDGDGDLDVTSTTSTSDRAHIMLNRGDGDLKVTTIWTVPQNAGMSCVADFDDDGDDDIITAHSPNSGYSLLRNNGDATFAAFTYQTLPFRPKHLFARHLNNDTLPDLIFCYSNTARVSVALNTGNGFATPVEYTTTTSPIWADSGDIDGDSDNDLVVAESAGNTVRVLVNNGTGDFSNPTMLSYSLPQKVALCRVDADSDLDLVVLEPASRRISIALNDGTGVFSPIPSVVFDSWLYNGLGIADFDADGDTDFSASIETPIGSRSCMNAGTGTFTLGGLLPNFIGWYHHPADFDSDGDIDLALGIHGTPIILNDGSGSFSSGVNYLQRQEWVAPGDFNGDGHLDLAVTSSNSRVEIMLNLANWPLIIGDPESQTREPGEPCVFEVDGSALAPLSYQWRKGGVPLNDGGNLSGTHSPVLTINAVVPKDAGQYDVVVTSFCGETTSAEATLQIVSCPADIVGNDGQVNVADLLAVITSWGVCPAPPVSCVGDVDHNGFVNVADLLAVITAWGQCPR